MTQTQAIEPIACLKRNIPLLYMSGKKSAKKRHGALIKGKTQPEFIYTIHKKNLSSETYKKTLNKINL
ncbi:hypothetical protein AGJ32_11180 [Cronobacter turicensis]|uniref:hypothetical protein n=1 Tax=Cronobacter turicensis TaxID=413502 RepID=UPI001D9A0290|nr:hypothetical protein [Cronobacter turicensis]EGT5679906.1 hypothetical protein [Cronobacter turicensis]EGT5740686.1 hypothetical protein [Cronobacter turicensis]ELY6318322.1 hypothetical protein [Cronobacter turicensis]MDI6432403.1 hypothetical protein [Cronobacter turicensis]